MCADIHLFSLLALFNQSTQHISKCSKTTVSAQSWGWSGGCTLQSVLATEQQMGCSSDPCKTEIYDQNSTPLPSHFIAVPATLFPIIKSHLKQHENDIPITELPLLLSAQSAGKAWPINQRAVQGPHIQMALFEKEGCGTLNEITCKRWQGKQSRWCSISTLQRLLSTLCSLSRHDSFPLLLANRKYVLSKSWRYKTNTTPPWKI